MNKHPENESTSKILDENTCMKPNSRGFQYFFCALLGMLFLISACKKDKNNGDIPVVSVNLSLPLNLPEYIDLNSVGNSIEITGGYKGILVYHRFQNEFVAYELACTYDPLESGAIVQKDSSNVIGIDYHCGSQFYLTDGSVLHGPATRSLKQYQTDYDSGTNTLYIFN
jgi:Rieske Fe-S protein